MNAPDTETPITAEDLTLLHEVSTSIHSIRDLDEMLLSIMRSIQDVFHIEGASLALHDADQNEFYFIKTMEEARLGENEPRRNIRFPDHLGVAGWVLRENRAVLIPDVSKDDRFFKGIDIQRDFVTRSMICCPLRTRKGFLGLLYALNKTDGEFTTKDVKLLEILSGTIAVAIENAKVYGELFQQALTMEKENQRLQSEIENRFNLQGVIGSSPAMNKLFSLLEKVMDTTTSVLIQGETGTGKEMIARVIHYDGPRKDKPFLVENCGALSEHLLESELFGHVKGAFTGAVADKKGIFELADGGTVFLDEIGEMSPAMQVKLLRVLQNGDFRPVGGMQTRTVDVRLLAATNRTLEEEVKKGNFREDLFYRVSVFPITLPPIRDRKEDIPTLANHFLQKLARKMKRPADRFSPRALEYLTSFHWPGNVRELENEVERAITLAGREKVIKDDYLSPRILGSTAGVPAEEGDSGDSTLHEVVARVEKRMILEALRQSGGNRSQAARELGLTRQGLLNKITRYEIAV